VSLKSVRNLEGVHVLAADQLNTYDVLMSDDVVFTKAALDAFVSGAQPVGGVVEVEVEVTEAAAEKPAKKAAKADKADKPAKKAAKAEAADEEESK
jgi:large subunit ribosomal protein L4